MNSTKTIHYALYKIEPKLLRVVWWEEDDQGRPKSPPAHKHRIDHTQASGQEEKRCEASDLKFWRPASSLRLFVESDGTETLVGAEGKLRCGCHFLQEAVA